MLLLIFNSLLLQAQREIKGIVLDQENNPLSGVSIIAKEGVSIPRNVTFTFSDSQGNFILKIPQAIDSLSIVFNFLGFKKQEIAIPKDKEFLEVYMISQPIDLKEVTVRATKPILQRKRDTTVFDLTRVVDGTEKVIEDLLKKLPGIEVDLNGIIKFEGDPVSHILLDSEDLFNNGSYVYGTKSIDAQIIDGVEAIKNYTENTVLQGRKKTNQIALNLKLKRNKGDFSGNMDIGAGISDRYDGTSHGLWVSKPFKSFNYINYNNIGIDSKFSSENPKGTENTKKDALPEFLLPNASFYTVLPNERSLLNNSFDSNFNTILKSSDKIVLHFNLGLKSNHLTQSSNSLSSFQPGLGISDINEAISKDQMPFMGAGKFKFVFLPSKGSRLAIDTEINNQTILDRQNILLNGQSQLSGTNTAYNSYYNQLSYTTVLNDKWVFNSDLAYQNKSNNQSFILESENEVSNQITEVGDQTFTMAHSFVQNKEKFNFEAEIGYNHHSKLLASTLTGSELQAFNGLTYAFKRFYLQNRAEIDLGKLTAVGRLRINQVYQDLIDNNPLSYHGFLLNPFLELRYKLMAHSRLSLSLGWDNEFIKERFLFANPIQLSNRTFFSNTPSLEPITIFKSKLQYNYTDSFNSFFLNLALETEKSNKNFVPFITFDNSTNFTSHSFLESLTESFRLTSSTSKYIGFLKSNLNLSLISSLNTFQNVINDSSLRDNTGINHSAIITLKTGFLKSLNFENSLNIGKTVFQTSLSEFGNTSWSNSFKVYYALSRLKFMTSLDYFKPSDKNFDGIFFFDSVLRFTNKRNLIDYEFSWKNNNFSNTALEENLLNDISTTTRTTIIQRPYLMLKVQFKL